MPSDTNNSTAQFTKAVEMAIGQARNASEQFTRMFGQMKVPGMPGTDAIIAAHGRNLEALGEANRVALEGAQAVAKRHMEITQQTMSEMAETLRGMTTAEDPQAKAAKQAELLKRAYERAMDHARELGEMIQQANSEALSRLNSRFAEGMAEIKGLVETAAASKPD